MWPLLSQPVMCWLPRAMGPAASQPPLPRHTWARRPCKGLSMQVTNIYGAHPAGPSREGLQVSFTLLPPHLPSALSYVILTPAHKIQALHPAISPSLPPLLSPALSHSFSTDTHEHLQFPQAISP